LFARDRITKSLRDWVDHDADLVVIWLEPGTPEHDGSLESWCCTAAAKITISPTTIRGVTHDPSIDAGGLPFGTARQCPSVA
jgi:hypothetical protein